MAKKTKDLTTQVAIRMEDDLAQLLADDAERHGRTVAQSARFLLRRALTSGAPA